MDKKVFSVYLGDPDRSNHAELDLPATPWELIDALDKLRLVDGREPYWQVEDIGRYGFLAPLLDDSGTAHTVAVRRAALNHKIFHSAVKCEAVIIFVIYQL